MAAGRANLCFNSIAAWYKQSTFASAMREPSSSLLQPYGAPRPVANVPFPIQRNRMFEIISALYILGAMNGATAGQQTKTAPLQRHKSHCLVVQKHSPKVELKTDRKNALKSCKTMA